MISIEQLGRPQHKREICREVLRQLPLFPLEQEGKLQALAEEIAGLRLWCAFEEGRAVGLGALRRHSDAASEIYLLCVLSECRRQGVGRMLLWEMEDQCMAWGNSFLTAKAAAAACSDAEQEQLRSFYGEMGFKVLETFEEKRQVYLCKSL